MSTYELVSGDINTLSSTFSDYSNQSASYIAGTGPCPDAFTTFSGVGADNLLTLTYNLKSSNVDELNGKMSDAVYRAGSVQKELGIRAYSKADYYDQHQNECSVVLDRERAYSAEAINTMRGTAQTR